jgi:hypothetical protein
MTEHGPTDAELESLLLAESFQAGICLECAGRGALYIVRGNYVGLCTRCVAAKIGDLRNRGLPLPEWVTQLEREVQMELVQQKRRETRSLQVAWDDLYRCVRCGKMIKANDARYPLNYPEPGIPPHCLSCYEAVSSA